MLASLVPDDGPWPCTITLFRGSQEVATIDAADAEDAARQAAILILTQKEGLKIGDVIQITRV
jgi:hypothetical protein